MPKGATALLALSKSATDTRDASRVDYPSEGKGNAAGRAQGVALSFGKGRVVVLGEAGMLSAQVEPASGDGREPLRTGMSFEGCDNERFALNVVRWLARVID